MDIQTVIDTCQAEPMVVVVGDYREPEQAFLVSENKTVCEINTSDIPIYLLAMFYVYNMCYPKGCTNFYAFLELTLFKLTVQVPSSVIAFITRLDSL